MIVSTLDDGYEYIGWTKCKISSKYKEEHPEAVKKIQYAIELIEQKMHPSNSYTYWNKLSIRKKLAMWLLKPYLTKCNSTEDDHLLPTYHEKWEDYYYVAECTVWELGKGWFIARDNTESKKIEIERITKEIKKLEDSM